MVIEAAIALATSLTLTFFLLFFVFVPLFAARYSDAREARLKELKKYSIRPLNLQ